jgi:hypothetical protein
MEFIIKNKKQYKSLYTFLKKSEVLFDRYTYMKTLFEQKGN